MGSLTEKPVERTGFGIGGAIVSAFVPDLVPEYIKPWVFAFGLLLCVFSLIWPVLKPSYWRKTSSKTQVLRVGRTVSLGEALKHVRTSTSHSWEESARQMQESFGTGKIKVRGLWIGQKDQDISRRDIPPDRWSTLYFPPEITGERNLNFAQSMAEQGQFREIIVDLAQLKDEFPNSGV